MVRICGGTELKTTIAIDPGRYARWIGDARRSGAGRRRGTCRLRRRAGTSRHRDDLTRAPSPIDDCRAVDDAAGVLSVTLWARRDRDAVRARLLSALSAFPGPDVRVAPDRLSTIVIRNGELLAIRRVLAGLGQLVIEHDAVDGLKGVDVDPYSTQY